MNLLALFRWLPLFFLGSYSSQSLSRPLSLSLSLDVYRCHPLSAFTTPLFIQVPTIITVEFLFSRLKSFQTLSAFFYVDSVCLDVDECIASPSVCDINANCKNTRGSYSCTCKPGFSGDGKTCTGEDRTDFQVV